MTAIAAAPAASARPVPWSRLGWVVWRRYRTTLIATIGLLALVAVYLVINGEQMRSSYHAFTACRPVDSAACNYKFRLFHDSYASTGFIGVVLMFLPGIVGAFAARPCWRENWKPAPSATPGPRASGGCAGPSPS